MTERDYRMQVHSIAWPPNGERGPYSLIAEREYWRLWRERKKEVVE